jgi:uncharacterized protein YjbJ (UPF0337 family)
MVCGRGVEGTQVVTEKGVTVAYDTDMGQRLQDEGTWQNVRGKARETWGDLTDDELDSARGNWDQFVGTVKEKTGETADAIQRKFNEWTDGDDNY